MKVMFLIPHLAGGGGERVLSELSCSLDEDTLLVVFERKFSYPFKGRLISMDLPISRSSVISRLTGFLRRAYRFRQLLRQERPALVISFMGEANLINALVSPRAALTVHNHMSALSEMRGRLEGLAVRTLNKALYRRATVVAVSQSIRSDLMDNFGVPADRVVVIPNAVDLGEIAMMAAEPMTCPWNPEAPLIIAAARLSREKGQVHLIRAFARVRSRMKCQLAVLGTGDLEEELKRLVSELGVGGDVYFLGWQSNPFKFMARASVFVSASLTEGFGLALLEAMACKVPVIATDCPGGQPELLAPDRTAEYGILVPSGDEAALAEAIMRLLADSELRSRYVNAGLQRVKDFDRTLFVERYRSLINRLSS